MKYWPKKAHIVILGPVQCGKTCLYNFLQNEKLPEGDNSQTIGQETIDEFKYRDKETGYGFIVRKTSDMSGDVRYVAKYYKQLIEKNNIIIFMFAADEFYEKNDYSTDVVDRIAVIAEYWAYCKKDKKENSFRIIPTMKDKAENKGLDNKRVHQLLVEKLEADNSAQKFASTDYVTSMYQTNEEHSLLELVREIMKLIYEPCKE